MKAVQQIKPFAVKVFVEDTDFQGFVYHANYLKFFERARSQFLNDLGFFQSEDKEGFFVVRDISITFMQPAKLEDRLLIESKVEKASKVRCFFYQNILREQTIIAKAKVEVCYVSREYGKPIQFPKAFLDRIEL
jgi:acyl-CoA thioester hydrolase